MLTMASTQSWEGAKKPPAFVDGSKLDGRKVKIGEYQLPLPGKRFATAKVGVATTQPSESFQIAGSIEGGGAFWLSKNPTHFGCLNGRLSHSLMHWRRARLVPECLFGGRLTT